MCNNKGYLVMEIKLSIKDIELFSPDNVSYNYQSKQNTI